MRRPESVQRYCWNDGSAFHPDFIVAVRDRDTGHHIALVEVKVPRGWGDLTNIRKLTGPPIRHMAAAVSSGAKKTASSTC